MENINVDRESRANPRWWNKDHDSAWERIKAALRADWEQTKADFSKKHGKDTDQDAGDTLKQMAGKEPPPRMYDWDREEPAMRYGYGSSGHYRDDHDWDDRVEAKLSQEWNDLKSGRTWDEVKGSVRRGWDWGRRKIS
jgi:hypothetical protein